MNQLFEPLSLAHGPALRNRLVLAPLTNLQSHADGTLSDDEHRATLENMIQQFGDVLTADEALQILK